MAKFVKKEDLQFINGFIADKDGNVFTNTANLACVANKLDTEIQKARYLKGQPEATPMPSLDGFVRESVFKTNVPFAEAPETPVTDARIAEAEAFAKEVDAINDAKELNEAFEDYKVLFEFVDQDHLIYEEGYVTDRDPRFDCPVLGNPLTWTWESLTTAISELKGYERM